MRYRVALTDKAERDIDCVLRWLVEHEAEAAGRRWFGQLMAKIMSLESHPQRCAAAAESADVGQEIRQVLLGRKRFKYRILFVIDGRNVSILRVWHSSRDELTRDDLVT